MELGELRTKCGFLCDMDGVLYHGNRLLPGVVDFVNWLKRENKKFLFLTNSSERAPRELKLKLKRMGLDVPESCFYTSALATAAFLASQKPNGSAYVIGEAGLTTALYEAGYSISDVNPDYVIVGETRGYNYEKIEKAVQLVLGGARLIGTNPDMTGPVESGICPATGAMIAPIELATGRKAYFIGKPNPVIMRHAIRKIGCRREETVIIGDRMETDIVAGIESDIETVLVLSGVAQKDHLVQFAYRPGYVLNGVGDLVPS